VVQLHQAEDQLAAAGAELAVIGNGAPRFLAGFRETTGYPGRLYTDPDLVVYRAFRLRRGLTTVARPSVVGHAVRAMRGGFRQGWTQGDPLQQGGVLVVGTDGELAYRYASSEAGDHPPLAPILAAARRAARAGG
jgi:hypothetical protein